MRFLLATLFVLLAFGVNAHGPAHAQGTDALECSVSQLTYPEGDVPPLFNLNLQCTVTNTPAPEPEPEPEPTPDPELSGALLDIPAIAALPAGEWLPYGDPWSDLETSGTLQQDRDNCNKGLDGLATAWNGVVWDLPRIWQFAPGGHGDGCFNGVISYDLDAGSPQVDAPHIQLNMPALFTYSNGTNGHNMPYASATPWPACVGQGQNCEDLSKADRLANGPNYPLSTYLQSEAIGSEAHGAFLRPRSSHTRQNTVKIGDYVYFFTAHTYGSIKEANQVWRFLASDPANTIERMPDRVDGNGNVIGGPSLNFIQPDGLGTFMLAGSQVCDIDPAIGSYNCASFPTNLSVNAVAMWDEERNGVWVFDPNKNIVSGGPKGLLTFVEYVAGAWVKDSALTVGDSQLFAGSGVAGICIVPTANGTNPVVWGDGSRLVRWDGTTLTEVTGQTNQPAGHNHVQNKWAWNDDLGVCLGTWNWNEGIWAWRPDFSNWQEASAPLPDPEPSGDWPVFAGHEVRPAPFTPAAWNEPIERQPEAPDYDALCPGEWAVLDYRTEADVAGSPAQTRGIVSSGVPNVRVYLHPREDADAPYESTVLLDKVQCGEVVGVPADGKRPETKGDVAASKTSTGLIVRGIDFIDSNVGWACHQPTQSCPAFTVLHDNRIGGVGLLGDSDPTLPQTYLEFRGNFFGPNLDWHGIYLERSIGKLIALSNVFHASGNAGHALKNLANYARIEGNVLSNVDIDGQPLQRGGRDVIGLFPLDHYACTDSIVRNNTIVFRTSGNVATLLTLRGRNAWGNCDKGRRRADGSREVFPPESPEYMDEARWAEIATAAEDFALGYEAARSNPELFTHLMEGNTFIVFDAKSNVTPRSLTVHTMRPIADNTIEAALKAEMVALFSLCGAEADYDACWFANASPELLYVHDRVEESRQPVMRRGNANGRVEVPNSLPIRAPENWVERTGVYWDENQTFVACNADGTQCAERGPYAMDIVPDPWDDVAVAAPPRVYALQ